MNIAEVNLTYPFVEYTVRVTHFTARKSTAIEWLILEAINRASTMPAYESVPVTTFFEHIFMIADADLLIRPCLLSLQDMEAVEAVGVSDDTELITVPMRNLRLTEKGQSMQRDGLLPGAMNDNYFRVFYDPVKTVLSENPESHYKDEPMGISVQEIETADDVVFPMAQIRQLLNQKQAEKTANSRFSWLMPTTRIDGIESSVELLRWKNVTKKFKMGCNCNCSIDGIDDVRLNTMALDSLILDEPRLEDDVPNVEFSDPDKEIREIVSLADLDKRLRASFKTADLCIVNTRYFSDSAFKQTKRNKKLRIAFAECAENFKVDMQGAVMVVYLPEKISQRGVVYESNTEKLCVGRFQLKASDHQREAVFSYIPIQSVDNVAEICSETSVRYASRDYRTLFTLYEIGLKDLFGKEIARLISSQAGITERAEMIENVNLFCTQVYNRKCLTADFIKDILLDEANISMICADIKSTLALLKEYEEVSVFRQQDDLFKALLKSALSKINAPNRIEEVWELWAHIKSVKKAHLTWIGQSSLYKGVYSNQLIYDMLSDFGSNDFEIEEYTPIEQCVVRLKRICERIHEILPEIGFESNTSNESIREALLTHKDVILPLNGEIRNWNEEIDRFETRACALDSISYKNNCFMQTVEVISRIADALSVFFDDAAVKYSKVYIVDTCTLMHDPELLTKFEDGKAMLIIPQIVVTELDGLKESEDEDKAYHARACIREINNHQAFDWLNLKEVSCPELLNADLNPQQSDNKILSIGIKYIVKTPVLLTDNNALRIKAAAQGMESMNLHGLEMSRVYNTKREPSRDVKKNKKKKRK